MTALTPKQQRFAQEYLIDLNATQAAIRAGYSRRTAKAQGSRLLTKVDVAQAIQSGQARHAEAAGISADYVLETIRETVERCRQELTPVTDRKGEPVLIPDGKGGVAQAFVFDSKGVLKGCELLGRNLSLWKDHVEMTHKHVSELSDAELEARLERARADRGVAEAPQGAQKPSGVH